MKIASLAFSVLLVASSFQAPFASALVVTGAGAPEPGAAATGQEDDQEKDSKKKKAEEKAKRDAEAKAAAEAVRQGLKAKESNARRAALMEASEVVHPAVIAEMAKALSDDDVEVRRTVIDLFGAMQHDAALAQLMKYAKKAKRSLEKDLDSQVNLIRAIGRHRDPESLQWLVSGALNVDEIPICRARVFSAAYQRTPEAAEALFAEMSKTNTNRLRGRMGAIRPALIHVTGTDQGQDPAKWTAWWSKNRRTFVAPEEAPKLTGDMAGQWRVFWGEARDYERRKKRGDRG